jgi:hypothetical protein
MTDALHMSRATMVTELLCLAVWARTQAARPRPGDFVTPDELRQFARNCRERAQHIEEGRAL